MLVDGVEYDMSNECDYHKLLGKIVKERSKYLDKYGEFQGLYNKYLVISLSGEIENGVFVLNPTKDIVARHAIIDYAHNTKNTLLSRDLLAWMQEFTDYECISPNREICKRVSSKVCCAHCRLKDDCYDDSGPVCYLVSSGDVQSKKECEGTELY